MDDVEYRGVVWERQSEWRNYSVRLGAGIPSKDSGVGALLGLDLPLAANTSAGLDPCISWVAPGEWLVSASRAPNVLFDRLRCAISGTLGHVADLSSGLAVYRMAGKGSRDFLTRGCSIDVHPRSFPAGACARTLFAGVPVLLRARGGEFQIVCELSFSVYLEQWSERVRGHLEASRNATESPLFGGRIGTFERARGGSYASRDPSIV